VSAEPRRKRPSSGIVVELVRLILVAVFTVGGWRIADATGSGESRLLTGILLGSAVGYVVGGMLGRGAVAAVSAVERDFRKIPASELLAGVLGLILGLVVALLVSILLFRLPPAAAYPTAAFITLLLGYLGYRVGRAVNQELFGLFGLKPRASGMAPGTVNVLDTSALIDGRVLEVARAGFLGGTFLVPRGVLFELQTIADSSDPRRRVRGQRGLEVLAEMQRSPAIDVVLVEGVGAGDVDAQLVRLARERGGVVVTSDSNLAKVAAALDVPVRSLPGLADALRPPFLPGEDVTVHLTKGGREHGQGVGYLDDGTMVVVDGGSDHLGADVRVTVTNILQTATGRMVFARMNEG
jgi:uncharacterized protein YacL